MSQTSTVRLLVGDYPDRLNALYAAVQRAKKDEDESESADLLTGEEPDSVRLAKEYEELRVEAETAAEEAGRKVVLKAIGRRKWRDLKEKFPPRTEGHEDVVKADRAAGINTDAVADDLVYASLVFPEFRTRADFDDWADGLSEGEFATILTRSWKLATVAEFDPKSLAGSRTLNSGVS